jgi:hypothetical protein
MNTFLNLCCGHTDVVSPEQKICGQGVHQCTDNIFSWSWKKKPLSKKEQWGFITMFTIACQYWLLEGSIHIFIFCFSVVYFNIILPSVSRCLKLFRFMDLNSVCFSHVCLACCFPCSSHYPLKIVIWQGVQIMKLLIMQIFPFSCYFIPLRSKYSPQHPVVYHP